MCPRPEHLSTKPGWLLAGRRAAPLALLVTVFSARTAAADGIPAYADDTGWHLLPEQTQQAVIALDDSVETMLLQVAIGDDVLPAEADRMVWVTPIPARPDEVSVDILSEFPLFHGRQPASWLLDQIRGGLALMALTQVYPMIPLTWLLMTSRGADTDAVTVHQQLTRFGVEVEVLSSPSIDALRSHLNDRGIALPSDALEGLGPYCGPEASLIIHRIADLAAYRTAVGELVPDPLTTYRLGVLIEFPVEEGFFPLVVSNRLPSIGAVIVTVIGFVVPVSPAPNSLEVRHFVGNVDVPFPALGLDTSAVRYTRFVLDGGPFETDLHFRLGAPELTTLAAAQMLSGDFTTLFWSLGLVLMVALSMLSALVGHLAWPKSSKPAWWQSTLVGFANVGTIAIFYVAARVLATKQGLGRREAIIFTVATSAAFCGSLVVLAFVTHLMEPAH